MSEVASQRVHKPGPQPVSFGSWMLTLFLMMIPLVNIIMLFVWAFGDSNPSKANYAKAALLWAAIGIVIWILLVVLGVSAAFSDLNY
ncbi:hypothetical protein Q0V21_10825 [Paenibacillus sp. 11B]|uniref:hypothetical protein n=1 Tax=unclassified Paenibacillus TaxID=185978 RepID=UPI002651DCC3|nr:hypothetical protein [Paenibacillus sp. 11B]MDN8589262.1 hypothetical protein [Paenibacillus sp. 11B]